MKAGVFHFVREKGPPPGTVRFVYFPDFSSRRCVGIIVSKQTCGGCFHRRGVPKLARTPAGDTGTLQPTYQRDCGLGEGKDVGEEMASRMGSSAWEASYLGRSPFRRDATQGSGFLKHVGHGFWFFGIQKWDRFGGQIPAPNMGPLLHSVDQKVAPFLVPDYGTQNGTSVHTFNKKSD